MNRDSDPMRAAALAPALPPEVESALRRAADDGPMDAATIRTHIATLTRERDALKRLVRTYNGEPLVVVADPVGDNAALLQYLQNHSARTARADALRWVLDRYTMLTADPETRFALDLVEELARLDAGEGV